MTVLLITYDLNKPEKDYTGLLEEIKKYDWAILSKSSYIIETKESPSNVYEKLKPHLDSDDSLCIIEVKNNRKVFFLTQLEFKLFKVQVSNQM